MPARQVEPYVWGFIGAAAATVIVIVCALANYPFEAAQPIAGGFFMGWLAGILWNWAGRER
jgi:hypothetical protein